VLLLLNMVAGGSDPTSVDDPFSRPSDQTVRSAPGMGLEEACQTGEEGYLFR
jgi:hypothetical protein